MAEKKGINNRIVGGIIGAIVILAVVIPVLILVTGAGNDDILPQQTTPELEIPFVEPEPTLTAEEIDKIISQPDCDEPFGITDNCVNEELFCSADSNELQLIAECQLITQGEIVVDSPPSGVDPETFVVCSGLSEQTELECSSEIEKLIIGLQQPEDEIPDIPPNGTETSIDDPYTQLCDQTPELIICGDSRSLELITSILKIDSAGVQTTVETKTTISQLSFFVEDTSNIDFRTGKLEFKVSVKGDPNISYLGTGKVDLLIGEQSIFTEPLDVEVDGIGDSEGKVDLFFISPTGIPSNNILFNFANNFDSFPDESITPVRLHVIELNIAGERDQNFALIDQDIFTINIAREDIKLLIIDEEGITSRVYPSDSRIILKTVTGKSDPYLTGRTRIVVYDSTFYGNGQGCSQPFVTSDTRFTPSKSNTATVPAPTISGISVLDNDLNQITSSSGGSGIVLDFTELTRNQNYTLTVNSPSITSSDLEYGKSQETKSYSCSQQATVTTTTTTTYGGNCSIACGSCYYITYQVFGSLNLGSVQCNIPTESP